MDQQLSVRTRAGRCPLQVDPSVSAVVHFVRSQYFKHMKDFAEFYKSSLLYLAYISSEALPQEQKLVSIRTRLPCMLLAWLRGAQPAWHSDDTLLPQQVSG